MTNILFLALPDLISKVHEDLQEAGLKLHNPYDLRLLCEFIDTVPSKMDLILAKIRFQKELHLINKAKDAIQIAFRHLQDNPSNRAQCFYAQADLQIAVGNYRNALHALEQVLEQAEHNWHLRARALVDYGWCHYYLGNHFISEYYFREALDSQIKELQAESLRGLGRAISGQKYKNGKIKFSEYEQAVEYIQKAYDIYSSNDNKKGIVECKHHLGVIKRYTNNFQEASEQFQECILDAIDERELEILAKVANNLGEVHYQLRELEKAEVYFSICFEYSRYTINQYNIAERLLNYGALEQRHGKYARNQKSDKALANELFIRSRKTIQEGFELNEMLKDLRLEFDFYYNLGNLEMCQDHIIAAISAFSNARKIIDKIPIHEKTLNDQNNYGRCVNKLFKLENTLIEKAKEKEQKLVWEETPIENFNILPEAGLYSEKLYATLLPKLTKIKDKRGRISPELIAKMLSTLQGNWFKNHHYALLGMVWTTATAHLNILTEEGILEKTGKGKGTKYRLHSDICPLPSLP